MAVLAHHIFPQQSCNFSTRQHIVSLPHVQTNLLSVANLLAMQHVLPQPQQIPYFFPLSLPVLPERSSSPSPPLSLSSSGSSSSLVSLSEKAVPQLRRTQLSIVLLDWDDTLFPTTAITKKKEVLSMIELCRYGQMLYDLLAEYVRIYGESNIYIVTNAAKGWVQESLRILSELYVAHVRQLQGKPGNMDCNLNDQDSKSCTTSLAEHDIFSIVRDMLISSGIRIISAQTLYAQKESENPALWKIRAFKQVTIEHFKQVSKVRDDLIFEIVSIGDSESEFVASFEAKYKLNKFMKRRKTRNNIIRLHRIKLKQEPSVDAMLKQFQSLIKEASDIHAEPGSVTIQYE
eukprot:CAMPEP_0202686790 /NCGR_PEP_ID=MMETSP1385-20130828/2558_1 /ASSEMBLY_ACC=CAM_ASM_000861 /TAXON_ID=933848 /ORGANISM="Elphidium margaritaceum" /LENGTH=345 /DNA_ID=CAMNT_0049341447 /DNA_START=131 /DNA_END=1168 /DNA_ORIENTATION=-